MNGFRQYRELSEDDFLVVGCDTSQGGNDYSTSVFISKTHLDIPLIYQSNTLATDMTNRLVPVLERIYDKTLKAPVIAYERNAGGVFEFERLATLNRANKYRIYTMMTYGDIANAAEKKIGWDTNTATRPKMLADLKDAVDHQLLRIYDKPLINELYSFIINKQGKPEAEQGSHDDLVMACAIAWQLQQSETPKIESNYMPYNKSKWTIQ
jgi:hypothetical protein